MFDVTSLFKKKTVEKLEDIKDSSQPVKAGEIKLDNIAVHVMPERFRRHPVKSDKAKITGLIIVIGGAVFLVALSALLYYYLFAMPEEAAKNKISEAENTQTEMPAAPAELTTSGQDNETAATSTGLAILPPEVVTATSTASTTPEAIESEIGVGQKTSPDSDADGLTDKEEIILTANPNLADSDGDGYVDGAETANLYDPAGRGKLITNPNIALYENKTFNYQMLYPKAWELGVNGGDDSVMFKAADNQFVQVIVQPNPNQQSLDAWYMEQLEVISIDPASRLTGTVWQGIKNPDGLTVYLMDAKQRYIYTITYNPGGNNVLDYINLYQAMLKSFSLID